MIYRENDKMSELLTRDRKAMQIVNRFGIPLGVGDKTIDAICKQHGIHTPTFLAIVNHETYSTEIDLPTLQTYLKNAHTYFLEFLLPRIRRQLIEAINPTDQSDQVAMLILRYFDEYVQEIRIHIHVDRCRQLEYGCFICFLVHKLRLRHAPLADIVSKITKNTPFYTKKSHNSCKCQIFFVSLQAILC